MLRAITTDGQGGSESYQLDLGRYELRRADGVKIKIERQPMELLIFLAERPGELVTREEVATRLWPDGISVDTEPAINNAIRKIRIALHDSAEKPTHLETVVGKGYRFIGHLEILGSALDLKSAPSAQLRIDASELRALASGERDGTPGGGQPCAATPAELARTQPIQRPVWWRDRRFLAAIAGIAIVLTSSAFWRPRAQVDRPMLQVDLDVLDPVSEFAISPDGLRVVFVAKGQLAIRRLDQGKIILLPGTQGAAHPFFSPDGQWVAFFTAGKLQKVAVEGGTPVTICDAAAGRGGSWGEDGNIIAALSVSGGLSRVSASGGVPQRLTDLKTKTQGAVSQRWPQVLPNRKGVLFGTYSGGTYGSLQVLRPDGGEVKTLIEDSPYGRYLADGYLVYYQRGTLFAVALDLNRLELSGSATPLLEGVAYDPTFGAAFDISSTGTLVYRRGTAEKKNVVCWLDSAGRSESILAKPGSYLTPRLAPDGRRLAVAMDQQGQQNLWIFDLVRETMTRLTFDAEAQVNPVWTPDGAFLAFRSGGKLAWVRSDGSGKVEHLWGGDGSQWPWSFSPDGGWLAFYQDDPQTGMDLWRVPVERTGGAMRLGTPQPLLRQRGSQVAPAISPDGRSVAYASNESVRNEVYVMPFLPESQARGGKRQLSMEGGMWPVWSRNGRELFYKTPDDRLMVVAYTANGDSFLPEKPRVWAEKRLGDSGIVSPFDISPDGKRVLVLLDAEAARPETHLRLLLQAGNELRRRALAGGSN